LGARNPDYELVIDPTYEWHTFYGCPNTDYGHGLTVTADGIYVIGTSYGSWNGDGDTPPIHGHSGGLSDVAILKLDTAGIYQWHTFYGSAEAHWDYGWGIAVTSDGVYATGSSNATWKGDGDTPPIHAYSGESDIFILKLDTAGTYQWHTFYGSHDYESCYSIAAKAGRLYVTGECQASWNGDGDTPPIHAHSGGSDIFILKLDTAGIYQWHTFYGAPCNNPGYGIAITADGVYVTGESGCIWKGDEDTPPIHAYSGISDIFILKLDTAGTYQWHTFYGAVMYGDRGWGIAAMTDGVYVTGYSCATWNGDGGKLPIHAHSGGTDIVILKLNTAGIYQWHTFYGATFQGDRGWGIAVTTDGIYVTGDSYATWNGDEGQPPIHAYCGDDDFVILKLNTAGAYEWHTFYGSTDYEIGQGIAVTADGVYVTGYGKAPWNGDGNTPPIHACKESEDIVVLKLSLVSTRYVYSNGTCGGKTPCHTTIEKAVDASSTDTLILIAAETEPHAGDFTLNADKDLTLQGGWDKSFQNPNGGITTLKGAPKAPQGSLTLQNLNIKP